MGDGFIHIPTRKKEHVKEQQVMRVTAEAYNALADIYNECTLSMTQLVSKIIVESVSRVVFDKED